MKEVLPGIWHWTAPNESIGGKEVSSYYFVEERVVLDPMAPPEHPDWFQPEHAILTTRHHHRDAWQLGATVWVVEQGAHELGDRIAIELLDEPERFLAGVASVAGKWL